MAPDRANVFLDGVQTALDKRRIFNSYVQCDVLTYEFECNVHVQVQSNSCDRFSVRKMVVFLQANYVKSDPCKNIACDFFAGRFLHRYRFPNKQPCLFLIASVGFQSAKILTRFDHKDHTFNWTKAMQCRELYLRSTADFVGVSQVTLTLETND
jgi:hypothetical protein